ncbi:hypothetical protein P7C70_g4163, partial [Phenoliferia sp. Uapishka_3]
MGTRFVISPEHALTYLKGALPHSHQTTTLRVFNGQTDPAKKTYDALRRTLKSLHIGSSSNSASPLHSPSSSTSTMYLFKKDGILYTNKGDKVDCRKCGENHAARDCPKPVTDYQDLSESKGKEQTPEAELKDKRYRDSEEEKSGLLFIGAERSTMFAARAATADGTTRFICNTGSENHGTDRLDLLTEQQPADVQIEGIVDGAFLTAKTKGTIVIRLPDQRPLMTLHNVLHSEKMSENIISLQKLADKGAIIVLRQGGG